MRMLKRTLKDKGWAKTYATEINLEKATSELDSMILNDVDNGKVIKVIAKTVEGRYTATYHLIGDGAKSYASIIASKGFLAIG